MPCEAFIKRRFSGGSAALIDHANTIIEEYQAQGAASVRWAAVEKFLTREPRT